MIREQYPQKIKKLPQNNKEFNVAEFQMKCPNCGSELSVDESWVGSTVGCPCCNAPILVAKNKDTASLVLGILGLVFSFACFGWILSLIGLIIGCKKKYKTGIVLGIVGLVINFLGTLLVIAGMLLPAMNSAREKARRVNCASNLKQVGMAFSFYQSSSNEMPVAKGDDGLDVLRTSGELTDSHVYICPSDTHRKCSYVYIASGLDVTDTADVPVVVERPENHDGYVNVLYGDGHVAGRIIPSDIDTVKGLVEYLLRDSSVSSDIRNLLLRNAEKYD